MTTDHPATGAIRTATACAGVMIAFQVAGRATRDALFLSSFDVATLPRMVAAAAAFALLSAYALAAVMRRFGPARLVPLMFAASAALQVGEWALAATAPRLVAILVYLQFSSLGALLISAFWSLINERFDPRTAKRVIGGIGSAGTVGGVAGGLIAERASALLPVPAMLPLLAALHVTCALLTSRIGAGPDRTAPRTAAEPSGQNPLHVIATSPYLVTIIGVILLATLSEGLLDYVFKASASASVGAGPALLRVFAIFYTATNLLGAVLSAVASRRSLERLGLARTVAVLPWTVVAGGTGALLVPGLGSAVAAKGAEAIVRNSLYRAGYELLFTPLPPREKRSVKPLLDVGAVRVGDILAAGLVQTTLILWAAHATALMLALAIAIAATSLVLTVRVHRGYVATLERNLLGQAIRLDLEDVEDDTTRLTLMHAIASAPDLAVSAAPAAALQPSQATVADPVLARLRELRSGDPGRVRRALGGGTLDPSHVPQAIRLLAWDAVADASAEALSEVAARHTGQLADSLLDPETDFAIRRRITGPLAKAGSPRAARALLEGLTDRRFEVRYRCGRALARMRAAAPDLPIGAERVYAAVVAEVAVDRRVWEGQRLLEAEDEDPLELGPAVRERTSRSLEHVFTVLSLVMPRQPLLIAFRGLHTDDPQLRGTALEYLEIALPLPVRDALWPFLDDAPRRAPRARSGEQILADLMASREAIREKLGPVPRRPPA